MAQFHKALSISEIAPGTGRSVTINSKDIAIFNVDGKFHAMDGTCPHMGGPLAEGSVSSGTVFCPWHGWAFNLGTGKCGVSSLATIGVYPTKVEDNTVFVEI